MLHKIERDVEVLFNGINNNAVTINNNLDLLIEKFSFVNANYKVIDSNMHLNKSLKEADLYNCIYYISKHKVMISYHHKVMADFINELNDSDMSSLSELEKSHIFLKINIITSSINGILDLISDIESNPVNIALKLRLELN
jgi:hypothetical protein